MDLLGMFAAVDREGKAFEADLQKSIPPVPVPMADSFHTAPGWRDLGQSYTCVPDAAYPWDPNVVRAIWAEVSPDIVPIWINWAFLSPSREAGEHTEVYGRHGLARYNPAPNSELELFSVNMPRMPCQGLTFKQPNEILLYWADDNREDDRPGKYRPFDMSLVAYLKANDASNMTRDELKERWVFGPLRRRAEKKAQVQADWDYRKKDIDKWTQKKLDEMSDVEMKDYMGRKLLGLRNRRRELRGLPIVP